MREKVKKYSFLIYMLLDALIITGCYFAMYAAFFYGLSEIVESAIYLLVGYIVVHVALLLIGKQYKHLWQYSSLRDYANFYIFSLLAGLVYIVASYAVFTTVPEMLKALFVVIASINLIIFTRVIARFIMREKQDSNIPKVRLAIIGGGFTASNLLSNMENAKLASYEPVAIFDDDDAKIGKSVNGVPIVGNISQASKYCKENNITDVIIAIPSASAKVRKSIINKLADGEFKLSMIPAVEDLISNNTKNYWSAVRDVSVEDLLGREVIKIEDPYIKAYIAGKVVLVTGGGGSIGSELCRQIAISEPKSLIIVDIYENNAYDIQQELRRQYGKSLDLHVEIASVRDADKINKIFSEYRPQIVYHAAAHKHVPLMETNPEEAIKNNVFGTYNVANIAEKFGAEKFLLISSDKAVNPTNVMGATKRFCEMIIQSKKSSNTKFFAVRFGNVLGSNGSVVPLFKKQIAAGGPVTITHKDIIRYFMTIPEAVQLVLLTASKAERGNVYVLDMGEPVRIDDFARKMIKLSGYTPDVDIKVEYTGLRPGEKLYEELLIDNKTSIKTELDKVFIESLPSISVKEVEKGIKILGDSVVSNDCSKAVEALQKTVSTFNHNGERNIYAIGKDVVIKEKSIAKKVDVKVASL